MYKIIITVLIFAAVSCSPRARQEQQASILLQAIERLVADENYAQALAAIDSFHVEFRNLVAFRREAVVLKDTVIVRQSKKIIAYCDSVLASEQSLFLLLAKNFRLEKDTQYQTLGIYTHKTQVAENNAERSYLKYYTDENAELYLESVYTGKQLEHRRLRVSVDDVSVLSDSVGALHTYDDDGEWRESLIFSNQQQGSIAEFVKNNFSKKIKVTLLGENQYVYWLTERDKTAIAETYDFWLIKKSVITLERQRKTAQAKIEKIISTFAADLKSVTYNAAKKCPHSEKYHKYLAYLK